MKNLFFLLLLPLSLLAQQPEQRWQVSVAAGVAVPLGAMANKEATTAPVVDAMSPERTDLHECCDYSIAGYTSVGSTISIDINYLLSDVFAITLAGGTANNQRDMQQQLIYYQEEVWPLFDDPIRLRASDNNSLYLMLGPSIRKNIARFSFQLSAQAGLSRQLMSTFHLEAFSNDPPDQSRWYNLISAPDYTQEPLWGGMSKVNQKHAHALLLASTATISYQLGSTIAISTHVQYQQADIKDELRYMRGFISSGPAGEQNLQIAYRLLNVGIGLSYTF